MGHFVQVYRVHSLYFYYFFYIVFYVVILKPRSRRTISIGLSIVYSCTSVYSRGKAKIIYIILYGNEMGGKKIPFDRKPVFRARGRAALDANAHSIPCAAATRLKSTVNYRLEYIRVHMCATFK